MTKITVDPAGKKVSVETVSFEDEYRPPVILKPSDPPKEFWISGALELRIREI